MRWVAYMPLRANSKSIPDKNLRSIAGKPLYAWSLSQAVASRCFDGIYVATDSKDIRASVNREFSNTVTVLDRSPENCTDSASTESAMLEFQEQIPFDVICLIQATSPLTKAADFRVAMEKFVNEKLDSLVTTVNSKRFFWTSEGKPVNYDPENRPRRQDFDGWQMENGAFYLTRSWVLKDLRCRLGGRIGIHEMAAETAVEIDGETDWIIVENLLQKYKETLIPARMLPVELLVIDIDGTLTDGGMYYGADGEILKKFNTRDGGGFILLKNAGIKTGIITSESVKLTERRAKKLGVDYYFSVSGDKWNTIDQLLKSLGVEPVNFAYIGDDINDLTVIEKAGLSFTPSDGVEEVRKKTDVVLSRKGGEGAVREAAELILKSSGLYDQALSQYLKSRQKS